MASTRGFASLPPEKRREIARKGGRKAQATGQGHTFTSAEAREAGRKGGLASQRKRKQREQPHAAETIPAPPANDTIPAPPAFAADKK